MSTRESKPAIEAEIIRCQCAVAEICETMKGRLPNIERAFLHADRQDLRARIAELKSQLESSHAE